MKKLAGWFCGFLVFFGVLLSYMAFEEWKVNRDVAGTQPTPVALRQLETGERPRTGFLELGPHWRLYGLAVYSFRAEEGQTEAGGSEKVEHAYYPIVSDEHPYVKGFPRGGSEGKAVSSGEDSPDDFAVLVRTERFDTVNDIPKAFQQSPSMRGMVVGSIVSLSEDEKKLISESFPAADMSRLMIFEEGRLPTPKEGIQTIFMIGLGLFLLGGLGLYGLFGRKSPPPKSPQD